MTLPPVVRVFFGIALPATTKNALDHFIGLLKKQTKTNAIRWTSPDNLHITLQFLAEVQSIHVPPLVDRVRQQVKGVIKPLVLSLGAVRLFPTPYRPRVIVCEVNPQNELAILSKVIGQGIQQVGYAVESRPFRAHLTLGRIKQPKELSLGFLSELSAAEIEQIHLNDIVLFRSEPQPEGSHYTVIEKIAFSD